MEKELIGQISACVAVYRDPATGIAWVEDGASGTGHSAHPNIDATGSARGMRDRGYWSQTDRVVRSHGFKYNIDRLVVSDEYDEIALRHCRCGGNHGEPAPVQPEDQDWEAWEDRLILVRQGDLDRLVNGAKLLGRGAHIADIAGRQRWNELAGAIGQLIQPDPSTKE